MYRQVIEKFIDVMIKRTIQTTINWPRHNLYQSIYFRYSYTRSTPKTHDMGACRSIINNYLNGRYGKTSTVGYHPFIWNGNINNRVGVTTIIKHCSLSLFCDFSWYLWKSCSWDSITTRRNQYYSTFPTTSNRYPNRNFSWNCDNSHIKGGLNIMINACGTLLYYLWTLPSNQTSVIDYFISHNTTLIWYGDGTIARLFSCAMLVELDCPNIIRRS